MIGIVDHGMGNLMSVRNALEYIGAEAKVCCEPGELAGADLLVLPGVGAFGDCMRNLRHRNFVAALDEMVIGSGIPILGICLGMQAMAKRSFEGGEHEGLGWLDADVVRIRPAGREYRVPHIGWNDVTFEGNNPLFADLPADPVFYFVHSYHVQCRNSGDLAATCDYGGTVTAAVRKGNIFGTQFHPEKSQDQGLRILENFVRQGGQC